jgi:multidrug resistance efflux pump
LALAVGKVTELGLTPVEALDFNWIKLTVRSDLSISIIEEVDLSSSKRAVGASVDHSNDDVS